MWRLWCKSVVRKARLMETLKVCMSSSRELFCVEIKRVFEFDNLRSKKSTSSWGGTRYLPYAFTEQGYTKADVVYDEIYRQAKQSIFIVDNYIGLKTLEKLINIQDGVDVFIFSDNLVKGLRQNTFDDFCKEYPKLKIQLFCSGGVFHDRYIILDYGTSDEKIFLCGASSKDAGGRITSILEDPDRMKYDFMIRKLLKNKKLVLK